MDESRRINIYQKEKRDLFFEVLIIILVAILLVMTFYKPSEVSGDSMLPNIENRDIAIMTTKKISRKDIVIADSAKRLIKRVVGCPGDVLEFRRNGEYVDVYINGALYKEDYLKEKMLAVKFTEHSNWHAKLDTPFTLLENEYYICGDNRNISEDSRSIGPVGKANIKGVVVKIFKADNFWAKVIRFIYRPEKTSNGHY